jgi:multicomponent Na+:H+ antiporter subunit E
MTSSVLRKASKVFVLTLVFFYELGLSSISVAKAAFRRRIDSHSAIIAVPIDLKTDFGIAALANLVTLTPGTCSLHVSDDRRFLYVHALDAQVRDDLIHSIKHVFERRIAEVER